MLHRLKPFILKIGIVIVFIFTLYLLHSFSQYYFSSKYDKRISEYIFKNGNFLNPKGRDTIYVLDNNYRECGNDSRQFIDRKYTRQAIIEHLNKLGYRTIVFGNTELSINGKLPVKISWPFLFKEKPSYQIHIWTECNLIIPMYSIDIAETYSIRDSVIIDNSQYEFSFFGENRPKVNSTKMKILN